MLICANNLHNCKNGKFLHYCKQIGAYLARTAIMHRISSEWTPHLIVVEPSDDLVALVSDLLAIILAQFLLQLVVLRRRLHVVGVALERVLRLNTLALLFVVVLVLLGVVHHAFDVGLAQATCNQRTLESLVHRLVTSSTTGCDYFVLLYYICHAAIHFLMVRGYSDMTILIILNQNIICNDDDANYCFNIMY